MTFARVALPVLLAALWCAPQATADTDGGIEIACRLPAGAVTALPAPFDKYMTLTCTRTGQALKPVDGYQWVFPFVGNRTMWLTANSPDGKDLVPGTHFTTLSVEMPDGDRLKTFKDEMSRMLNSPLVYQSTILRLAEVTSNGEHKEIYLLIPPESAKANVLGIECVEDCIPMEQEPWLFIVTPVAQKP